MQHITNFQEFLYEVFYTEHPMYTDDSLYEDFGNWFDEKTYEEIFDYGDQFHKLMLKKVVVKLADKLTTI